MKSTLERVNKTKETLEEQKNAHDALLAINELALKQIRVSKFLEHDLPKAKHKLKQQENKFYKQIAFM